MISWVACASSVNIDRVDWAGDTVAVVEEENPSAERTNSVELPVTSVALAGIGLGVIVLLDSAGKDALILDWVPYCPTRTSDALASRIPVIAGHTDTASRNNVNFVGPTLLFHHAQALVVQDIPRIADTNASIVARAVGPARLLDDYTDISLLGIALITDAGVADFGAEGRAHNDDVGRTNSLAVLDVSDVADTAGSIVEGVNPTVNWPHGVGINNNAQALALAGRKVLLESDLAGTTISCPVSVGEAGTALGILGGGWVHIDQVRRVSGFWISGVWINGNHWRSRNDLGSHCLSGLVGSVRVAVGVHEGQSSWQNWSSDCGGASSSSH